MSEPINWNCNLCFENFRFNSSRQIGGHILNCHKNPKKSDLIIKRSLAKIKEKIKYQTNCITCDNIIELYLTKYKIENGIYKKFCSRKCANQRSYYSKEHQNKLNIRENFKFAAKKNRITALAKRSEWKKEAVELFIKHRKNSLFMFGIGLYWGEGSKTHSALSISNADPGFIRHWLKWHTEFSPNLEVAATIYGHEDVDINLAKQYWTQEIGLKTFHFVKANPKSSSHKRPRRTLPYGTCRINTKKGSSEMKFKMLVWIDLLRKEPYE